MVPGATPVWMGFGPVYRKLVELTMVVATPGSIGGATVPGSDGTCRTWTDPRQLGWGRR
jgi:hypothetical protein